MFHSILEIPPLFRACELLQILAHFLQVIAINCIRLSNSNPYLPGGLWLSLRR